MVRASVVTDGMDAVASQYEAIRGDYARRAQIPAKYVVVKEGTTFYADHCDGTGLDFDNTTLDALLTEVFSTGFTAGRTYKEKIVIKGEHTGLEQITIPSYTIFEVQGVLQAKAALNDNFIENSDIVGGNEFIEILGGTIDANGANQTDDTNTIHFENVDFSSIHHSILKGGMRNTTDGETVELATCTFCGVHNIHGFLATNSYDHIKLTGTSTDCLISNNILDGSGGPTVGTRSGAIQAATGCDRNSIVGNLITTAFGGVKLHNADDNLVEANKIYGLTGSEAGIDLIATSSRNQIIGNKINGIRTLSGIRVKQTAGGERLDDNVIHNNTIYNYNVAGARGIDMLSGGRRTRLTKNTVIGNAGGTDVGIIIAATQIDDTWLRGNDLRDSNVNTKCTDAGTGTTFDVLNVPFVDGTTFLSADGASWGWEIDLATEYAIALCQLPPELSQIMRIRIRAVSIILEADGMTLQIDGYGGTSNEAEGTETIAVVNKVSSTTNFAANDYVYWELTAADDADIGHLTGGDRLQLKVQHEATVGADIATDAVFQAVEIEYV